MTKALAAGALLALLILWILHKMVHISIEGDPTRVILGVEVGMMSLIAIMISWDHIMRFVRASASREPESLTKIIPLIIWAFIASVGLYLVTVLVIHFAFPANPYAPINPLGPD